MTASTSKAKVNKNEYDTSQTIGIPCQSCTLSKTAQNSHIPTVILPPPNNKPLPCNHLIKRAFFLNCRTTKVSHQSKIITHSNAVTRL